MEFISFKEANIEDPSTELDDPAELFSFLEDLIETDREAAIQFLSDYLKPAKENQNV